MRKGLFPIRCMLWLIGHNCVASMRVCVSCAPLHHAHAPCLVRLCCSFFFCFSFFSLHNLSLVTLRYKAIGLPHSKKRVLKNVPVRNYSLNKQSRKRLNLVWLPKLDPGNWRRTLLASGDCLRTLSLLLRDQCVSRKEPFQRWKESGRSSLLVPRMQEEPFRQPSQKMITKLVRHFDQDERQTDAAVHRDSRRLILLKAFADKGAHEFSEHEFIQHIHTEEK